MKSGGKKASGRSEAELLERLKTMEKMERETRETLGKYLSALDEKSSEGDTTQLLLEKIEELRIAETLVEEKDGQLIVLQNKLTESLSKQEEYLLEKKKIIDDQVAMKLILADSDKTIRKLGLQIQQQEESHMLAMNSKLSTIKSLEEECNKAKLFAQEQVALSAAAAHEANGLHGAMASLHGEIAILTREIEDHKEREKEIVRQRKDLLVRLEMKEGDVLKLRQEKQSLESRYHDLEKKVNDTTDKANLIQHESSSKVDTLVRERDNVTGSLAKMSQKLKQQTQANQELNALLTRMKTDLTLVTEEKDKEKNRAEEAEKLLLTTSTLCRTLETTSSENDIKLEKFRMEVLTLSNEVNHLQNDNNNLKNNSIKITALLERLEKDKSDLLFDTRNREKEREVLSKNVESLRIMLEDLQAKFETERNSKERALELSGQLEADLDRVKSEYREAMENSDSLARQLREADRMREQAIETSRNQQRENANRIVEFSQKNAKLNSDYLAVNEEKDSLRRQKEELMAELSELKKDKDDSYSNLQATRSRLLLIEDQFEEALAKAESRKAEVEELRETIRREANLHETAIADINKEKDRLVREAEDERDKEIEASSSEISKIRISNEQTLEKALVKSKEIHLQQLEETRLQYQRETSELKSRITTLAKTIESLGLDLREETNKNKVLHQELSVLQSLAEAGSSEAQERVNYVERERIRDRNRLEGQLADVKEQLRQQMEQKQQRDQLLSTVEQQLGRERDARFTALQRVRTIEDENSTLCSQIDNLAEENASLKKLLREGDRKLTAAVAAKDAELLRLARRNEVLGEAVTRLTDTSQASSVGKYFLVSNSSNIEMNASVDMSTNISKNITSTVSDTDDVRNSPKKFTSSSISASNNSDRLFSKLDSDGIYDEDDDEDDNIDVNVQSFRMSTERAQSAPNYGRSSAILEASSNTEYTTIEATESIAQANSSANATRAKSASSTTRRKLGVSTNKGAPRVMDIDQLAALSIINDPSTDHNDGNDDVEDTKDITHSPRAVYPTTPSPNRASAISVTPFSTGNKSDKSMSSQFAEKIKTIVESEKYNNLPYSPQPKSKSPRFSDDDHNENKDDSNGNELRNLASPITVLEEMNNNDDVAGNNNDDNRNDTTTHTIGTVSQAATATATYTYINERDIKTVEKAKVSNVSSSRRKTTNTSTNYNVALKAFDIAENSNSSNSTSNKKTGRWRK